MRFSPKLVVVPTVKTLQSPYIWMQSSGSFCLDIALGDNTACKHPTCTGLSPNILGTKNSTNNYWLVLKGDEEVKSLEDLCKCLVYVVGVPSHLSALSSDVVQHKYGQQPGGDTLSDFVTLVCQEAHNAQQVSWFLSFILKLQYQYVQLSAFVQKTSEPTK